MKELVIMVRKMRELEYSDFQTVYRSIQKTNPTQSDIEYYNDVLLTRRKLTRGNSLASKILDEKNFYGEDLNVLARRFKLLHHYLVTSKTVIDQQYAKQIEQDLLDLADAMASTILKEA